MLPTKIKNDIIRIRDLFNNYAYMKKNKAELEQIKTNIIDIINILDNHANDAMINLAFKYNEHMKNEGGSLNSKDVMDAGEFYENCGNVKSRFRNFLNKLERRISTLEMDVVELSVNEKDDFYYAIKSYIENYDEEDETAEEAVERILIENIIDLNYVPQSINAAGNDEDDEDEQEDIDVPLIIMACEKDNLDIVKILYYNNANINVNIIRPDGELSFNPLSAAILKENIDIIRFLLDNGANLNIISERDITPLKLAILQQNYPVLIELIDKYNADVNFPYDRNAPLHFACERRVVAAIDILLERSANINQRDNNGNTPLHRLIGIFANNWVDPIKKVIDKFIDRNFEINSQNSDGNTILHLLINRLQNPDILRYWLSKGVAVNLINNDGNTPLQLATQSRNMEIYNIVNSYQ